MAIGGSGVAPDVTLVPIKFIGFGGQTDAIRSCAAFQYALEHGVDITNNSWGPGTNRTMPFTSAGDLRHTARLGYVWPQRAGHDQRVCLGQQRRPWLRFRQRRLSRFRQLRQRELQSIRQLALCHRRDGHRSRWAVCQRRWHVHDLSGSWRRRARRRADRFERRPERGERFRSGQRFVDDRPDGGFWL